MATFQVIEQTRVMSPDVFGVWQAPRTGAAFGAWNEPANMPQWRVDLSAQPQEIAHAFTVLESSLQATDNALALAKTRLDDFVNVQQTGSTLRRATAFASAPEPEAELNRLLLSAGQTVAFGATDWVGDWKNAIDEFVAFAQQIQQHTLSYALVDTRVAQARVGMTRVTWGGDFESVWTRGTAQTNLAHQAAVRAALLSRQQLLKQFVSVIRGAGQLAGLALIAANPVLALPAALRFLKLLLDEIRKSQS